MAPVELRGISWDHPRGHDCMVATAEAYAAVKPDVRIVWETRSLQDFADFPVQKLAETYDLLVIDHPFVGFAAADGCLLPLDEHIDAGVIADQATHSVGPSHQSYLYSGHQWPLDTSRRTGPICWKISAGCPAPGTMCWRWPRRDGIRSALELAIP